MKRNLFASLLLVTALGWCLPAVAQGLRIDRPPNRWAVVVGVDNYLDRRLPPARHASETGRQLATILRRDYGYSRDNVLEMYNERVTGKSIESVLASLAGRVAPVDSVFIYLSLHISESPTRDVFIFPQDARTEEPWTWVSWRAVLDQLSRIRSRATFVIAEGCLDSTALNTPYGRSQAPPRTVWPGDSGGAVHLMHVCSAGDPARQRPAYAESVIAGIAGKAANDRGTVTAGQLFRYVNRATNDIERKARLLDVRYEAGGNSRAGEFSFERLSGLDAALLRQLDRNNPPPARLEAISALVKSVDALPPELRSAAVTQLGDQLRSILRETSQDSSSAGRNLTLAALSALGTLKYAPSVDDLGRLLQPAADPSLQAATIETLAQIGTPEVLPPLRAQLKNSDPNVRSGAIGALIRMRDQASAPAIVDVIRQDKETAPRLTALAGLPTMNGSAVSAMYVDAVIGVLSDPSSEVRKEAVMALGQVGDRRALPEILRVSKTERDRTVRQAILYTIGKLANDADAPAVEAVLLDSLDSAPAESAVREAAVYGLGKVRNPRAERRLITALNDADPNVQRAAAEALGDLGSSRAIDPLINLLDTPDKNDKYDKNTEIRRAAAVALGKIGNERALRPLLLAVKDENPYVRAAAEAAVKRIGSQSGETGSLSELTRDPSPAVRAQVAGKLGVSKDPAALSLLIRLLGDPDYTVRRSAVAGLANFRDPASLEKIAAALDDDDLSTRQGAATVLGLAGNPQSVEALAAHARDSQGAVRAEIIRALGRIKDERSLPAIVSANQDPDPPVRLAVAEALASFSTPAARVALEALARDSVPAVRDAALASLKALPPSPPAPPRNPRRSR